jgi:hypothetical protein
VASVIPAKEELLISLRIRSDAVSTLRKHDARASVSTQYFWKVARRE